ncbi:MAG: hypothetical protein AMJ79_08845 [Phycisphaerae bacterium SM23_30]|nr:MAG: hypothetical protein AMJ79_08845 [Phycisphaerae bacterium SM23_30]
MARVFRCFLLIVVCCVFTGVAYSQTLKEVASITVPSEWEYCSDLAIAGNNMFLGVYNPNGAAWVGFTAGTGADWENHDILSWSFNTSINYGDFGSTAGLYLIGNATREGDRLRLTPSLQDKAGAAWYAEKQEVLAGFETIFQFQITDTGGSLYGSGGDGFAFVIQGDGGTALGGAGHNIGYGGREIAGGITNSVAVEFDTWDNSGYPFYFPDGGNNHISVQSRGTMPNDPNHDYSLGSTSTIPDLSDGNVHTVKITYVPGTMRIYLDDLNTPVLTVSIDLKMKLNLDSALLAYDITDHENPTLNPGSEIKPAMLPQFGPVEEIKIVGNLAYLAHGWLTIVDVSDPNNLVRLCSCNEHGPYTTAFIGLDVSGKCAFMADHWQGLRNFDVSGPCPPIELGSISFPSYEHDVEVQGTTAYVISSAWDSLLASVDVSDPNIPTEISRISLTAFPRKIALSNCNKYAYVASDEQPEEGEDGGLFIIDITDSNNMKLLSSYPISRPHDVAKEGNLACVVDPDIGLYVIDISDPSNPQPVYFNEINCRPLHVEMNNGLIYVSCQERKVFVFAPPWEEEPLVNSVFDEIEPKWSPDGKQIAILSNESGNWQLYIINADGSGKWNVTSDPNKVDFVTWSPDSQYLLYAQGDNRPRNLFKVKLNQTRDCVESRWNLTCETSSSVGWESPQFSPDGLWIAAIRGDGGWPRVYVTQNIDSSCLTWSPVGQSTGMSGPPVWGPDSLYIYYAHHDNWQAEYYSDIWAVKPDVSDNKKIIDRTETKMHIWSIAVSPDSEFIIFSNIEEDDPVNPSKIGRIRTNGSGLTWFDGSPAGFPQQVYAGQGDIWSSFGDVFVFHRKEYRYWNIWLQAKNDEYMKRPVIIHNSDDKNPRISIDNIIAYQTNRNGNWDIYLSTAKCPKDIPGDLNDDCRVDLRDFAIFAMYWITCYDPLDPSCWR